MATKKTKKDKKVDLPPKGATNPDPLSGASGSHPIETGVGAAVGGAAAGMAVGALGGPVGAVVGGIVGGAVAGGLAGKGVGELIDPTLEDTWLREYHETRTDRRPDETHEHYRPAFRYGLTSYERHQGRKFDEVEHDLRSGWDQARGTSPLSWDDARGAARHAYERIGTHRTTCPTGVGTTTTRVTGDQDRRDNMGSGTSGMAGTRSNGRGHTA